MESKAQGCDVCRPGAPEDKRTAALATLATGQQGSDVLKRCGACGVYWREDRWSRKPMTLSEAGGAFPLWMIEAAPWTQPHVAAVKSHAEQMRAEVRGLGVGTALLGLSLALSWAVGDGIERWWEPAGSALILIVGWAMVIRRALRRRGRQGAR